MIDVDNEVLFDRWIDEWDDGVVSLTDVGSESTDSRDCVNCETADCSNCEKHAICKKCTNCRGCRDHRCDTNLTSNTPAVKTQIQKIIQQVVRVQSSLYTMNVGALNAYRNPYVTWNRMSDRGQASVQKTYVPGGGGQLGGNSTRSAITRCRPGALSPGGVGCDIKHNSYDRYLNRLKGRGPLRRGVDAKTPPISGGKVVNFSIVSGCNCPSF
jgi:hypothetical protein